VGIHDIPRQHLYVVKLTYEKSKDLCQFTEINVIIIDKSMILGWRFPVKCSNFKRQF